MIVTTAPPVHLSFLHRITAGYKFLSLFCISLLLFLAGTLPVIITAFILTTGLYKAAHQPLKQIWQQVRPIRWLLLFLAVFQLFYNSWYETSVTIGRIVTLLLLAGLIMLTTTTAAIMASFERIFQFLRPLGVNPAQIALVLSLTLRFIPMLAQISREVRKAQQARGLEHSLTAIAVPVLIRTLKMSGDISVAIEARCYHAVITYLHTEHRDPMSSKDLVMIALGAALVAAFGLLPPVPLPLFAVPLTAQTLAVMLTGALFGAKRAVLALSVFLLLIAAGLPLLPGGRGGPGAFMAPTSGYLIGFLFSTGSIGWLYDRFRNRLSITKEIFFLILGGIAIEHACGILGLVGAGTIPFSAALTADLVFIPGDLVKAALACITVRRIRRALPQNILQP